MAQIRLTIDRLSCIGVDRPPICRPECRIVNSFLGACPNINPPTQVIEGIAKLNFLFNLWVSKAWPVGWIQVGLWREQWRAMGHHWRFGLGLLLNRFYSPVPFSVRIYLPGFLVPRRPNSLHL